MVSKFGDVYPHMQHHLIELHATPAHFRQRLLQVEDHMSSDAFKAPGGEGLLGLAKELRSRREEVNKRKGEHMPKRFVFACELMLLARAGLTGRALATLSPCRAAFASLKKL